MSTTEHNETQKGSFDLRAFYEFNKKRIFIGVGAVAVVVGIFLAYTQYWIPQRENEAAKKLAKLRYFMEVDSFSVILNGAKGITSAVKVADEYGSTRSGKEAAFFAGAAYLRTGKFEKSLEYLDKTSANDKLLGPSILSAKAACYAELGKYEKAGKAYEKAADWGDNDFTAGFYRKSGIMYERSENYKDALRVYQKLKDKYPQIQESQNIDAMIYKVKGLLGELE